jgi:hypothetical protein
MSPKKIPEYLTYIFTDYLVYNAASIILPEDFEAGAPLSDKEIQSFEKKHGIIFPLDLKNLFHDCNGVQIKWEVARGQEEKVPDMENTRFQGQIRLLTMEEIMEGWKGTGWKDDLWFDWFDEVKHTEEELIIKDLRPFEYYDNDDSGCACFLYRDGRLTDNVYTNSVDDGIHDLRINFEQYVDLMLMCYGVYGWQTALHTPEPDEYDYYHARRMDTLKNLNVHIPSFSFEEFMDKVKTYQGGK